MQLSTSTFHKQLLFILYSVVQGHTTHHIPLLFSSTCKLGLGGVLAALPAIELAELAEGLAGLVAWEPAAGGLLAGLAATWGFGAMERRS